MGRLCVSAGLLLLALSPCLAYQSFQSKLPNGDRVPDPAQANILWKGVGHLNAQGGGTRNVFGLDFAAQGFQWTPELCGMDSDSDGKTNGEELGDPDCTWTPGNLPSTNLGLSHPGICEPLDNEDCQAINKDVLFASADPFDCPATKQADVKATDLRINPTPVPEEETNYFCKFFDLNIPAGTQEHVIAYEPIIDNAEVMHHTIIYGCRAADAALYVNESSSDPAYDCRGGMVGCQEVLFLWAVGMNGQCHPEEFGGLVGEGGYTGLVMEMHWNNPQLKAGLVDSSGIKLYHTPTLRPNNAAYVLWGPTQLELKPGEENILKTGGCGSACTNTHANSIYITQISPHMHYYGRAMEVSHNGKSIVSDRAYNYDSPVIYSFEQPIEVKPGDSIGVNCTFTTTSATKKTYFGLGTYDEMCFAITLVYPYDNGIPTFCQYNEPDMAVGLCGDDVLGDMDGCNMTTFWQEFDWVEAYTTLAVCDDAGLTCLDGCAEAVDAITSKTPCLSGKTASLVRGFLGFGAEARVFINQLTSCLPITYDTYDHDHAHDHGDSGEKCDGAVCDHATALLPAMSLLLLLLAASILSL